MRKFRFFTERTNLRPESSVKLPDFEAKHIKKSLRLSKGDTVYLFNGQKEFEATLGLVTDDAVMANIVKEIEPMSNSEVEYTIFVGLPKGKAFEVILEKLSELGISNFVPIETEYSVVKPNNPEKKFERYNKIILNACKQSERVRIPQLHELIKFDESIDIAKDFDKVFFFTIPREEKVEESKVRSISDYFSTKDTETKRIAFYIGPEGGFSPNENNSAIENDFELVKLFDTVLKAETAAISAMTGLRLIYG